MCNKFSKGNKVARFVAFALIFAIAVPMLMLVTSANNTDLPEIPIGSGGLDTDTPGGGGEADTNPDTPPTDDGGSGDTGLIIVIVIVALVVIGILGCVGYAFFAKGKKGE